jgi:hypothetical protein
MERGQMTISLRHVLKEPVRRHRKRNLRETRNRQK